MVNVINHTCFSAMTSEKGLLCKCFMRYEMPPLCFLSLSFWYLLHFLLPLLNVSFTLQTALNRMNRIIFEGALKPGAADGNRRVWSTVKGGNVFSIYTKISHCQIITT